MSIWRFFVDLQFRWYDLWIGFYYQQVNKVLYFCPLPMCVIVIQYMGKGYHGH